MRLLPSVPATLGLLTLTLACTWTAADDAGGEAGDKRAPGASVNASASGSVRKDVRDLTADEMAKYREAIRRLQQRGPQRPVWMGGGPVFPDPKMTPTTGYAYQAMLHTYHCPHDNWWFFPWHRAYLFYFEQILQDAVKDFMPGVPIAIPYWNWTDDATVPELFTQPAGTPLADDRRFSVPLDDSDVGPDVLQQTLLDPSLSSYRNAFSGAACAQREAATGSPFEDGPHGIVHVKVGGTDHQGRPGTMAYVPTAAFDPIFWSHHANIDRLWDVWVNLPGRQNPPFDALCPNGNGQPTWGGLKFTEFVDAQGTPVNKAVQEILADPAVRAVRYAPYKGGILVARNKGKPPRLLEAPGRVRDNGPLELKLGKPLTLEVPLPALQRKTLMTALARTPGTSPRPIRFHVEKVKTPAIDQPPVLVRAFLNKPDANATTSVKDEHYIGYFTFFGGHPPVAGAGKKKHAGGEHAVRTYPLNLGPTLTRLRLADELPADQPLQVTLVVVPVAPPPPNAKLAPAALPIGGGKLIID